MTAALADAIIPDGIRNVTLTSIAGSLRACGATPEEMLVSLRNTNLYQCDPPLPDIEVRAISKSIGKKPPYPTKAKRRVLSPRIPRGCFDPRLEACGFNPAAIIGKDTTLRLKSRHKAIYGLLQAFYGPLGCWPSQATLAEEAETTRQQIARDVRVLEYVGLIQTEPGAHKAAGADFPCTGYHFVRHVILAESLKGDLPSTVNDLRDTMQHFSKTHYEVIEGGRDKISSSPQIQTLTPEHATESVAQLTKYIGAPACLAIFRYFECSTRCGGCRVEYYDGTVKQYECSCEINQGIEL